MRADVAPEVARYQTALVGGQAHGLRSHHPLIHRRLDGVRGHHLQEHLVGRLGHLPQVTARAVALEEWLAGAGEFNQLAMMAPEDVKPLIQAMRGASKGATKSTKA